MVTVCTLVRTQPGQVKKVLGSIKEIKEVKESFAVFGRYDIVAFFEAPEYEAARAIARKINELKGVKSTETLVEA